MYHIFYIFPPYLLHIPSLRDQNSKVYPLSTVALYMLLAPKSIVHPSLMTFIVTVIFLSVVFFPHL